MQEIETSIFILAQIKSKKITNETLKFLHLREIPYFLIKKVKYLGVSEGSAVISIVCLGRQRKKEDEWDDGAEGFLFRIYSYMARVVGKWCTKHAFETRE